MRSVGTIFMIAVILCMAAAGVALGDEQMPVNNSATNEPVTLFLVVVDGKWGYMDPAGNVMIAPQYECAWDFYEGLACIQLDLLRGYIDSSGKTVIKPQFSIAGRFSNGRASVNGAGNGRIPPRWGDFFNFYHAWDSAQWYYVDKKGNSLPGVIPFHRQPEYQPDPYSEGARASKKGDLWGYCDRSGQYVVEPRFEEAYSFSEGLAPVAVLAEGQKAPEKRDWKWQQQRKLVWGFIDKTGKTVVEPKFEDAWSFSGGLASVRLGGKWGYIDKTGAEVLKPQFDYAWPLSEGRGRVLVGGKHGYLDEKGQEVIKPQFDGAWEFSKGLARVIVGDNEWYINPKGEYVWDEAKRKIHSELLALRNLAADGKGKDAAVKIRAYAKEHAGNAYVRGAVLPYLGAVAGADALDELCAATESGDSVVREIAARSLMGLSGEGITEKLTAKLGAAKEPARAVYIDVLGVRGDKTGLASVREQLKEKSENVQLAALHAVARLGGTNAIPDLVEAMKTGTPAMQRAGVRELGQIEDKKATVAAAGALPGVQPEVKVGLLRLLAERGAKEYAAAALTETAHTEQSVRLAACGAVGALGGEKELAALIGLVTKAQSDKDREAAVSAIAGIASRGVKDADACAAPAIEALGAATPETKPALLAVLGRIGGAKACGAVEAAAKDNDAGLRDAAVRTLIAWPDGFASDAVLALARTSQNEALQEQAKQNLVRMLGLPSKREAAKSLELCVAGMEVLKKNEDKQRVLACMGRIRTLDAMKTLSPYLEDEGFRSAAANALVEAGSALAATSPKEVKEFMKRLGTAAVDKDTQQRAKNVVTETEKYEGFITAWAAAGPYSKEGADAKKALEEVFAPENPEAKDVEWKPLPANARNWSVDLSKVFDRKNSAAYLRVTLESPSAQEAVLELGSNEGVKAWLNGEAVHSNNVLRGLAAGQDKVKVNLKEGNNTLLLKVSRGGGGSGVCARLKKPSGETLALKGSE